MNPLDYVLIGVLLFFLIAGYRKGFVAQILQIIGIVVSFFLACRFHLAVAENSLFDEMRLRSASAAQVTAWVAIFLASAAVLSVIASYISKRFQNEHMRAGDRWMGALLSTAKGAMVLGGIALGLQEWKYPKGVALPASEQLATPQNGDASHEEVAKGLVTSSVLVPHLADACFAVVQRIPAQQRAALREMIDERRLHLDPGSGAGSKRLVTPVTPGDTAPTTRPEPTEQPVLVPLGELRRMTLNEREGSEPVPSTSKEGAENSER